MCDCLLTSLAPCFSHLLSPLHTHTVSSQKYSFHCQMPCSGSDTGATTPYPDDWIHFNNSLLDNIYHFHVGFTDIESVEDTCWNTTGGYLLSLSDPSEEEFLRYSLGGKHLQVDR